MSNLNNVSFYTTPPHDCSYLSDQQATTLFLDPDVNLSSILYSQLSYMGFRRSGKHLYRPHCENCNACIPLRVPADKVKLSRSQKRILKKNQHLTCVKKPAIFNDEHYALYEQYINARHAGGDMAPPDTEQYRSFLTSHWEFSHLYEFRDDDRLVSIAITDQLADGLAAVYTFFDCGQPHQGYGSYSILKQLELCREQQQPYLYLGYWIKNCDKMRYKNNYHPAEMLIDNQWVEIP